jgi:hypothetical protein
LRGADEVSGFAGPCLTRGQRVMQIPIKLYTNRKRPKNASHEPSLKWTGDMAATEGIEAWIAGIANASR